MLHTEPSARERLHGEFFAKNSTIGSYLGDITSHLYSKNVFKNSKLLIEDVYEETCRHNMDLGRERGGVSM